MNSLPLHRSLAERAVEALGGATMLGGDSVVKTSTLAVPGPDSGARQSKHPTITRKLLIAARAHSMEAGRSRCSEELSVVQNQVVRTIRSAQVRAGSNARLVLVTSARPGEGKSFTSLNLAIAIARAGVLPALLVDTDIKPRNLTSLLGCLESPGLRNLAGQTRLAAVDLVVPTEVERLQFLPCGILSSSGPDVPPPSGNALSSTLLRLAEAFPLHAIVIDTPPVLSTSEASALASAAGQVLMVVQAETTQRSEVEAALDMLDSCPMLQLVLNQAHISASDSFGAYGYEAYNQRPD